jgi:putative glutathione S-transferase
MGLLVDGQWQDKWYDTDATDGKFVRSQSQFRNWVTADGAAGESGKGGFNAQAGRYHLYVSLACPWAHRTLIFRALKKLDDIVSVTVVNPLMHENGWELNTEFPDAQADPLYGLDKLYQLYQKADANYSGRVTVPVLWDKQQQTIVSNESADIIRMFNSAFNDLIDDPDARALDFYPNGLHQKIDDWNARVYEHINNGVYKAGFATSQQAYSNAVGELFGELDHVEQHLSQNRYLTGERLSEADWRLFTTLIRFDAVYVGHFKCNIRRIQDYPNLSGYLRELYQVSGIQDTVNMQHIQHHYYRSHKQINPTGIVPAGPQQDFSGAHLRDR